MSAETLGLIEAAGYALAVVLAVSCAVYHRLRHVSEVRRYLTGETARSAIEDLRSGAVMRMTSGAQARLGTQAQGLGQDSGSLHVRSLASGSHEDGRGAPGSATRVVVAGEALTTLLSEGTSDGGQEPGDAPMTTLLGDDAPCLPTREASDDDVTPRTPEPMTTLLATPMMPVEAPGHDRHDEAMTTPLGDRKSER